MNQIRTVLQRMFGLVKHHVGTDQFGNKYYYVPEQKSWTGQTIRSKRMIEAVNRKEIEYEVGNIPSEWEVGVRTPCVTRSGLHDWLGYEGAGRTHQPKRTARGDRSTRTCQTHVMFPPGLVWFQLSGTMLEEG
ncbi:NADH dehydrogenase [ubiquinone] 1 alpha subcomplex assembly factor 2 isoform X5 [Stegostoma tigrinum]|uniref:NADH dehydrogenase [ubiquinone] 1 alpha subcomplex assembly factor 2 isoform X5 n=1 Tax=Stegostoma tigrinum TaxID=3053191 RepID=UPI0028704178|nr:NADH dehydrogenase [ubiquinone] 1 alpha subcomplex assembly factor 2 isoform X5 [Stegostoma tigrinum]